MNKVVTTPTNTNFYSRELSGVTSGAEQMTSSSRSILLAQTQDKQQQQQQQQMEQQEQEKRPQQQQQHSQQSDPLTQANKYNGIQMHSAPLDTPLAYQQYPSASGQQPLSLRSSKNVLLDYSNYYALQPGYPTTNQNTDFLNASSNATANGNAGNVSEFANTGSTILSPSYSVSGNSAAEIQLLRAKQIQEEQQSQQQQQQQQQQHHQPHAQYSPTGDPTHSAFPTIPPPSQQQQQQPQQQPQQQQQQPQQQQQEYFGSHVGNYINVHHQQQQQQQRPSQLQQHMYSAKLGNQNLISQTQQPILQSEKSHLEIGEHATPDHHHQQQQQQQQQQQMLVQAFGSPGTMLYSQSSLPQYTMAYSSSVPTNPTFVAHPSNSTQRQVQVQSTTELDKQTQIHLPLLNPSISSTFSNKSRNSSTFSARDQGSRAISISSSIPQAEYPENVVRPKVATTRWDDENTNCYQVRAKNILVSRREDTDYINCTKLLNVVGMTRGKRDGILKTEKIKNVVKVGSMNLKGVWIPFDRAYEIARNEGVDGILYPLFVKNIKEYFLTKGHKLKSEDDLEEGELHKNAATEGSERFKLLDEASQNFEKDEEECSSNGYSTSIGSSESKYRNDYFDRTLKTTNIKEDKIFDESQEKSPLSVSNQYKKSK
ncbi:EFH1 [Candida oxycetoniae]|uniref:EFH1 n=1 Tax=Candida oxycetoniae TaxID=497107 RepID=A0AAI9T1G7_9ASCO|nr:EFH1 [Candida oxycetoniae]KAI3406300.2 EFH1 [Candida oxycetoniae]